MKANINWTSFDWQAYLPIATALARNIAPDAEWVTLSLEGVGADGRADISKGHRTFYAFRAGPDSRCRHIMVMLRQGAAHVSTEDVAPNTVCREEPIAPRRCTLAQVHARGIAEGIGKRTDRAHVAANARGWMIQGSEAAVSFVDDCGAPSSYATLAAREHAARRVARRQDEDARLVSIAYVTTTFGQLQYVELVYYSAHADERNHRSCITVTSRAHETTASFERGTCETQQVGLPSCRVDQLVARMRGKLPQLTQRVVYTWTHSGRWHVLADDRGDPKAQPTFQLEDDC